MPYDACFDQWNTRCQYPDVHKLELFSLSEHYQYDPATDIQVTNSDFKMKISAAACQRQVHHTGEDYCCSIACNFGQLTQLKVKTVPSIQLPARD